MTPSQIRRENRDNAIAADYRSGMTIDAIMDVNGVGRQSVYDALARKNVTLRRDTEPVPVPVGMGAWLPMETAPKDGPIIYLDGRECIGEAYWKENDGYDPDWWDEANTETVEPLYWMPRPATPKP